MGQNRITDETLCFETNSNSKNDMKPYGSTINSDNCNLIFKNDHAEPYYRQESPHGEANDSYSCPSLSERNRRDFFYLNSNQYHLAWTIVP